MADDALLTTTHREFLDSDADRTGPSGRSTRLRIRQRVHAGLEDFTYLADPERFEERDAAQLWPADGGADRHDTLTEMIAFVYRMDPDGFETIVAEGARRGVDRVGPDGYQVGEVEIPIEKSGVVLEHARECLDEGKSLSPEELEVLLVQGDVPAERIREHVTEHGLSPSPSSPPRFR